MDPMIANTLMIVNSEIHEHRLIYAQRRLRRERIATFSVDHSRWLNLPIPLIYCPEAENKEQKFGTIRSQTADCDRLDAWRKLSGPKRWNLMDWLWSLAE